MKRTFVIGDIHGALKALEQLIGLINPQQQDLLIFLGDYVDGWSESAQVINYLMHLDKTHQCIFLKGNHDGWCEDWLDGATPDSLWLQHGGTATVESYHTLSKQERSKHLTFFKNLINYHIDNKNRLFIHAGFTSMHGPQGEHFASTFSWDRTLWELAIAMDEKLKKDSNRYPKRLQLFEEIYIGHTPTTNYDIYEPMNVCTVWNIDTGAAFNGKLTAVNIDEKQFFQSDTVQSLYLNEKGRNR